MNTENWLHRLVRKFRRNVPMEWNLPVPPVDFTKSTFHFSINYTVWMGNASLCFCDSRDRAEWVARAFNGWLQTDDGKAWLVEVGRCGRKNAMNSPETQSRHSEHRLVGRCIEIGDDDAGQPRLIIHTTREEIMRLRSNLAFADVEVRLHIPNDKAQLRAEKSENPARDAGGALADAPCSGLRVAADGVHAVPLHRSFRRWAVQFTATRGEMTGTVKMGALGDTWEDACQFVRTHCDGQYDSIGEITEISPNSVDMNSTRKHQ